MCALISFDEEEEEEAKKRKEASESDGGCGNDARDGITIQRYAASKQPTEIEFSRSPLGLEREGVYANFLLAYWGFVLLSWGGTFSLLSWSYAWGCAAFVGTAFDSTTDVEVSEFAGTSATNTVLEGGNHCSTD
ncbi:unnamed protein product [Taenia asiatica]|uniref:Na_Ca_ex domain-containing protein n=1 Tax=Taenia asiatica TaxID=60517 RepID=A0A0R3VZB6_TAEAS|nr:unnamed protein product [Taenia asiatica]